VLLFDTNAISALVHHRRGFDRLARLVDDLPVEQRLVSAITLSEIETMIANVGNPERKFQAVHLILANFNLVDFGDLAAAHAGRIRAYLEPRGMTIGPLDTLIAAHARSLGAAVVTNNVDEFRRVPDLEVISWRRSPSS
jgi:tRNA(fMet)-specific endonuclease VapC